MNELLMRVDGYALYATVDSGHQCYDLYEDDGAGYGDAVARGYDLSIMRALMRRLAK